MANYVKSTNFASKDALAVGNPLKIVKGTEIDTEFNNIATAVNTKADINSPALTGNPTAPTPTFGNNTTSLATTAFVQAALQAVYPVGSVYINASSATNPATLLGFGTWVEFGSGRVLVGQNTGDTSFDVLEETGGSKDAIVVAHTHTSSTASSGAHQHFTVWNGGGFGGSQYSPTVTSTQTIQAMGSNGDERYCLNGTSNAADGGLTSSSGAHSHSVTVDSTGSSGTNANLQPYVVVKMWKRTA